MSREIPVTIIGDIAFNTDITPDGEKTSIGGAAYYAALGALAARNLIQSTSEVGMVASVGDDFDLSTLTDAGLPLDGIYKDSNQKTCHFTAVQHADNTRDFTAERNVAEKVYPDKFPDLFLTSSYIHLATSLPQNYLVWTDFLRGIYKGTISSDAFELFTQQFPIITLKALNSSDLIFINEFEERELERKGGIDKQIPKILKKGSNGASYIQGENVVSVSVPKVKAVETSGAGDTLAGAFLFLISQGLEKEEALKHATQIASKSVTKFGVDHLL